MGSLSAWPLSTIAGAMSGQSSTLHLTKHLGQLAADVAATDPKLHALVASLHRSSIYSTPVIITTSNMKPAHTWRVPKYPARLRLCSFAPRSAPLRSGCPMCLQIADPLTMAIVSHAETGARCR
jgi:hypothetical protein